jgi:hypothetical protein
MQSKVNVILDEDASAFRRQRKPQAMSGRRGGSRPVSRVLSRTVIHLGRMSPYSSSDLPGDTHGPRAAAPRPLVPLFGLAPGGVYPATGVATGAVRSYRTISPLPPGHRQAGTPGTAVSFLWHFPWARAPQALPGTLPDGARTFLPARRADGATVQPTPTTESLTEIGSDMRRDSAVAG